MGVFEKSQKFFFFKHQILSVQLYQILKAFKSGFPKVGQVAPLGAMTDIQGATSSKGTRGGS